MFWAPADEDGGLRQGGNSLLLSHLRVDCSGRRVASLDVDGVIKVWSFNPIMQTKASSISKSPLLSLEWATKRDRLVSDACLVASK